MTVPHCEHCPRSGCLYRLLKILATLLAGAIVVVAPFVLTPFRRYVADRFRRPHPADPGDSGNEAGEVVAVPVDRPETRAVSVEDRDVPAVHLVSVIPGIDPVLHEEGP